MSPMYKILVLCLFLLLASCAIASPTPASGPTSVQPATAPAGVSITDDAGRVVSLKERPKRIVSLSPSNTEIVYALGQGELLVGVTEFCDYPPEAREKPKIGGFSKIDLEKVVGSNPDLVLATGLHVKTVVPELEKRGLAVAVADPKTVDDVLQRIALIGQLLGAESAAEKVNAQIKARLDSVAGKIAKATVKPRVWYEIDKNLYTAGPGSYIDDMLNRAGGINVAAETKTPFPQLTLEALVQKDPEVILLADAPFGESAETVKARPGWANLTAVKTGRIVPILNENVISRPGPRVGEGLELLASAIYPDLFKP